MSFNCKQGGLSDEVWNSSKLSKYVTGWRELDAQPCGYVGERLRTIKRDKLLERYLKEQQGLGPEAIGMWLTSKSGRHLMDCVERSTTIEEFYSIVRGSAYTAAKDIICWSHPDHKGNLGSSLRIERHVLSVFTKESIIKSTVKPKAT